MYARFINGLKLNEPIELKLAVSMGNQRQTKEHLASFIELINKHNQKYKSVEKCTVILSSYLQRHYLDEQQALALGSQWIQDNKVILQKLTVPYEIIEWKSLLEEPGYETAKQQVDGLYATDVCFKETVTELAKTHDNKGSLESAIHYLLEECAVFLNMKGHVAYPNAHWNQAVKYVLQKFPTTLSYHGYFFVEKTEPQGMNSNKKEKDNELASAENRLFKSCLKTTSLLNEAGIYNQENQIAFFKQFLELKNNFANNPVSYPTNLRCN